MAEGIKISEMEQIATLEDGCCFPVVSNGVNKKITQKNLYKLMTSFLDKNKTNYIQTTMEDLELSGTNDVSVLWQKIYNKYGTNGVIKFEWNEPKKGFIKINDTTIANLGGILIYTCNAPNLSWVNFSALFISCYTDEVYKIECFTNVNPTKYHSTCTRLLNLSDRNELLNNDKSQTNRIQSLEDNSHNKTNLIYKYFGSSSTEKYITVTSQQLFGDVEVHCGYSGKWIFTPVGNPLYISGTLPNNRLGEFKNAGLTGWAWSDDYKTLYLRVKNYPIAVSVLGMNGGLVSISDWSTSAPSGITFKTDVFDVYSNFVSLQSQITNNDNDIASLQNQITSNDDDISYVRELFANYNTITDWFSGENINKYINRIPIYISVENFKANSSKKFCLNLNSNTYEIINWTNNYNVSFTVENNKWWIVFPSEFTTNKDIYMYAEYIRIGG